MDAPLKPIFELGVDEAYDLLTRLVPAPSLPLPPLDAIENEDWGRDYLLSRLRELGAERLNGAGVTLDAGTPEACEIGTLGALARSELAGLWSDRTDLGDSLDFARSLRRKAEDRSEPRTQ
jgi:hypothetical protein